MACPKGSSHVLGILVLLAVVQVLSKYMMIKDLDPYSPPYVDRIWGIWGSYYNIPKAIFYLLKGDYVLLQ